MTSAEREEILRRAELCCEYCLSQYELSHDDFSIEHITPKAAGGTDSLDNLAFSAKAATTASTPRCKRPIPSPGSLWHSTIPAEIAGKSISPGMQSSLS